MDELRWILLGLGILIIAGVYGYARLQDWRRDGPPWRRRGHANREPFAHYSEPALDDDETLTGDPLTGSDQDDDILGPARVVETGPAPSPAAPTEPTEPPGDDLEEVRGRAVGEEKIIALSVMAPDARPWNGADVAEVLESADLRLTAQGVFQRTLDTDDGPVALFTVANIVEPGTFDAGNPGATTTPGIVLIMQLPAPFDGLAAFELMLAAARRVAQTLGGQLLDGRRCDLTTQAIEHLREELLEYRRRARLADRRRSGGA
ncbi:cell division protein ZipA C-terminal FtsZ-binding domain-containing protein [Spiribacter vilamensis]|uniref:Cell division protein ZipA n=1 Tax=Spiribacter vilamensis TaxID=531306 RepID=A0A4Q8D0U5_9GAMM|nr:cell division protein ZipA C-terminal FtsZ-binding domain-containing protein [Spiribacter vilamensis]RZU98840.1 cell division protein ZipA [Spiribacter vilamensis]